MLFDPQICFFWEGTWPARHVEPLRRIYETELVYLSQGAFDLQIDDRVHAMRPGAIALIPPNVWHESRCGTKGSVVRHCMHFEWQPRAPRPNWQIQAFLGQPFNKELLSPVPESVAGRIPLVALPDPDGSLLRILDQALARLRRGEAMGRYLLWPVLSSLLDQCDSQLAVQPGQRSEVAQAAMLVRDYIDLHYGEPHSYKVYTQLSGLSASHLCQAFKRLFGRTPNDYLSDLRLSQAHRILQEEPLGVEKTSRIVGIRDSNYFARIFRQRFGVTPSAHARQAKGRPRP